MKVFLVRLIPRFQILVGKHMFAFAMFSTSTRTIASPSSQNEVDGIDQGWACLGGDLPSFVRFCNDVEMGAIKNIGCHLLLCASLRREGDRDQLEAIARE
eukprot:TRINITY_DN5864_c0_g1_i4.p1 TRINITY_DN5864_c0_g1~~TRINITY_DN5864_c0_g1_i4.p1  ORF type:complete len:100 (-),score=8.77 TRINITY_DN5864_c0_g1_i4:1-300(-)